MDEYPGKRTIGRFLVPKKSSSLALKNTAENRDGDAQFCTRVGCSGRLNHARVPQMGNSKKSKPWRSSCSSSGKEATGSSFRTCLAESNAKTTFQELRKKMSSKVETDSSKIKSAQDKLKRQELKASPRTVPIGFPLEMKETESRNVTHVDMESSSGAANIRNQNSFRHKSLRTSQNAVRSFSSSSSESSGMSGSVSANASNHCLRNLQCNSIPNVVPPGRTLLEPKIIKRRDIVLKTSPEGESSSVGGKMTMNGPAPGNKRISIPTNGLTIVDSRRHRIWSPRRDSGVALAQTRRSMNGCIRATSSNERNENNLFPVETSVVMPRVPSSKTSRSACSSTSLHQESFSSHSSSYGHMTENDNIDHMIATSAEHDNVSLISHGGSRRFNMDSIVEVLLMLERIEQDEEPTYEQLLDLEINLFRGGISFFDRHRDLRLDIDNMSYEELLALEEEMGTVSTALPEDALLRSLKSTTYQCVPSGGRACSAEGEDLKCSICQEEYVFGDEVGKIGCEHGYHMGCITQWLRLKNWCPICKASVVPAEL